MSNRLRNGQSFDELASEIDTEVAAVYEISFEQLLNAPLKWRGAFTAAELRERTRQARPTTQHKLTGQASPKPAPE